MSSYRKNILVGITMIAGLLLLGWMILKFGGALATPFAQAQVPVVFVSDRADGIFEGSSVLYRGVNVGRVIQVQRSVHDPLRIEIDARLDAYPPLPANVEGIIRSQGFIGSGSVINLELRDSRPEGQLAANATIPTHYAGLEVFPRELTELARDLTQTSRQFRESNLIPHLDEAVRKLQQQVGKAGDTIDSVQSLVSDPKIREDLKAAVGNLRSATETANRVGQSLDKLTGEASQTLGQARTTIAKTDGRIDDLFKQVADRLLQVSKVLDSFQSISGKIDKGEGTAGLILNDPKLYQSLVDSSRQLNATISDLKRLVEQWEQEGMTFRLNK